MCRTRQATQTHDTVVPAPHPEQGNLLGAVGSLFGYHARHGNAAMQEAVKKQNQADPQKAGQDDKATGTAKWGSLGATLGRSIANTGEHLSSRQSGSIRSAGPGTVSNEEKKGTRSEGDDRKPGLKRSKFRQTDKGLAPISGLSGAFEAVGGVRDLVQGKDKTDAASRIADGTSSAVEAAATVAEDTASKVPRVANALGPAATGVDSLTDIVEAARSGDKERGGIGIAKGAAAGLMSFPHPYAKAAGAVLNGGIAVYENREAIGGAVRGIAHAEGDAYNFIFDKGGDLGDVLSSGIGSAMDQAVSGASSSASNLVCGAGGSVQDVANDVSGVLPGPIANLTRNGGAVVGEVTDLTGGLINNLGDRSGGALRAKFGGLGDSMNNRLDQAGSATKSAFYWAGDKAGSGIANMDKPIKAGLNAMTSAPILPGPTMPFKLPGFLGG